MAIIIHHNKMETEETKCTESICNKYGWHGLELNSREESKIIYCCQPDVITQNFGFKAVNVFNITNLANLAELHADDACS